MKISLITFILKYFKKYSIYRKIFEIIKWISSFIFGFSIIDIYGLDFINWVKDSNIYKWYHDLFNNKKEESKLEITSEFLETNKKYATRDETRIGQNSGWTKENLEKVSLEEN